MPVVELQSTNTKRWPSEQRCDSVIPMYNPENYRGLYFKTKANKDKRKVSTDSKPKLT